MPNDVAPYLSIEQSRKLATAVAVLSRYSPERWEEAFREALDAGIAPDWLYESILQSYLFLGYPAGIEGLRTLALVMEQMPASAYERWKDSTELWQVRGIETAQQVYRHHLHTLLARLETVTPELTEWMIVEGYGKVLGRPVLPLPVREFLIVVVLGTGTFTRQLEAHLFGARNVGTPLVWLDNWFASDNEFITTESFNAWEHFRNRP